jgi:uncharacterized membrane protein YciS (DUF1049 family)
MDLDWLVVIMFYVGYIICWFIGCVAGWFIRGYFVANAKHDEQMIDEALTRAYQAGRRAKQTVQSSEK